MMTGNLEYKRVKYNFKTFNKDKTKREYLIYDTNLIDEVFTEKIRIDKDNGFHDRSRYFDYWLYFRNDTDWTRCRKTGLSLTQIKNVSIGDVSKLVILKTKTKKGKDWEFPVKLLIVQFSEDLNTIVIDCFKDFYTNKKDLVSVIINEHNLHLPTN